MYCVDGRRLRAGRGSAHTEYQGALSALGCASIRMSPFCFPNSLNLSACHQPCAWTILSHAVDAFCHYIIPLF